jgi:hypothetical protein
MNETQHKKNVSDEIVPSSCADNGNNNKNIIFITRNIRVRLSSANKQTNNIYISLKYP